MLAQSSIYSWTEGRVFGTRLPARINEDGKLVEHNNLMPRRCAVVTQIPSTRSADNVPMSEFGFDVKSFGADDLEAKDVDLAIYEHLHYMRRGGYGDTLIYVANALNNGFPLLDPDANWPYVLRSYTVTMAEKYIAA